MAVARIRLLLADDHPIVREGIRSRLSRSRHLQIVGEAASGRETIRKARSLRPDVVLLDVSMPDLNGMEVARQLRWAVPMAKVLVLSAYDKSEYVREVLRAGARGYLLKDSPPDILVRAIEAVHAGETRFSSGVEWIARDTPAGGPEHVHTVAELSPREQEVLAHIAAGDSTKQIAVRLGLGVRSVDTFRARLMRKLGIHNVAGLTRFALAVGLTGHEERGAPSPARCPPS
jgi:DNA-binding NarL/FixJ family response regulator